jgi:hypothetical protein
MIVRPIRNCRRWLPSREAEGRRRVRGSGISERLSLFEPASERPDEVHARGQGWKEGTRILLGYIEKLLELVAVPAGVVTLMGPVAAPAGTVAVILVEELTV